ncbi:MAG TPA: class I SAM-dependent methyltransferase [Opitutaceae bacterium]
MASNDYVAKSAYRGDVAARYEEQRVGEATWSEEQAFIEAWVDTLPEGSRVLDIPTGTGRFLSFFKRRSLRIFAWDISEDMLGEVRRLYPEAEAAGWDIRKGDAEHLDLPVDSVDYVLSWRFFHLIPVPVMDKVLREFHRVCAGTIVIQVFAVRPVGSRKSAWVAFKDVVRPWLRRLRLIRSERPWAHITSYSHREEELLGAFSRAGMIVCSTQTSGFYDGLPSRVYFLRRRGAGASA